MRARRTPPLFPSGHLPECIKSMVPAFNQILTQPGAPYECVRVYACLLTRLDFRGPRPLKAHAIAAELRINAKTVASALNWLVAHRYVLEDGRDTRGVRQLTLAWTTEPERPSDRYPGPQRATVPHARAS